MFSCFAFWCSWQASIFFLKFLYVYSMKQKMFNLSMEDHLYFTLKFIFPVKGYILTYSWNVVWSCNYFLAHLWRPSCNRVCNQDNNTRSACNALWSQGVCGAKIQDWQDGCSQQLQFSDMNVFEQISTQVSISFATPNPMWCLLTLETCEIIQSCVWHEISMKSLLEKQQPKNI